LPGQPTMADPRGSKQFTLFVGWRHYWSAWSDFFHFEKKLNWFNQLNRIGNHWFVICPQKSKQTLKKRWRRRGLIPPFKEYSFLFWEAQTAQLAECRNPVFEDSRPVLITFGWSTQHVREHKCTTPGCFRNYAISRKNFRTHMCDPLQGEHQSKQVYPTIQL